MSIPITGHKKLEEDLRLIEEMGLREIVRIGDFCHYLDLASSKTNHIEKVNSCISAMVASLPNDDKEHKRDKQNEVQVSPMSSATASGQCTVQNLNNGKPSIKKYLKKTEGKLEIHVSISGSYAVNLKVPSIALKPFKIDDKQLQEISTELPMVELFIQDNAVVALKIKGVLKRFRNIYFGRRDLIKHASNNSSEFDLNWCIIDKIHVLDANDPRTLLPPSMPTQPPQRNHHCDNSSAIGNASRSPSASTESEPLHQYTNEINKECTNSVEIVEITNVQIPVKCSKMDASNFFNSFKFTGERCHGRPVFCEDRQSEGSQNSAQPTINENLNPLVNSDQDQQTEESHYYLVQTTTSENVHPPVNSVGVIQDQQTEGSQYYSVQPTTHENVHPPVNIIGIIQDQQTEESQFDSVQPTLSGSSVNPSVNDIGIFEDQQTEKSQFDSVQPTTTGNINPYVNDIDVNPSISEVDDDDDDYDKIIKRDPKLLRSFVLLRRHSGILCKMKTPNGSVFDRMYLRNCHGRGSEKKAMVYNTRVSNRIGRLTFKSAHE